MTISSSERIDKIYFGSSTMSAKWAQAEMSSLIGHAQNDRASAKKLTRMPANSCQICATSAADPLAWHVQLTSLETNSHFSSSQYPKSLLSSFSIHLKSKLAFSN